MCSKPDLFSRFCPPNRIFLISSFSASGYPYLFVNISFCLFINDIQDMILCNPQFY
jgi:hypothetical protein